MRQLIENFNKKLNKPVVITQHSIYQQKANDNASNNYDVPGKPLSNVYSENLI
jgi:hypothetical protein